MNERELQAVYARLLETRAPADRADCPPPEALRALVERDGPEAGRLRTLDHVMGCAHCRPEFELLRTVAATHPPPARSSRTGLAAAAAIALVIGAATIWRLGDGAPEVMRGAGDVVETVAPAGALRRAPTAVVWRAVPEALRYEVEIADDEGGAVFSATTRDTAAAIPTASGLTPGTDYFWWVEAVLADGRRLRSEPRRFSIRP
ncbi:MAG TPA: fibronectin type III domain-containing protein [Longimicrobiales bacterium]